MKRSKAYQLRKAIVQAADSLPVEIAITVPELYEKWTAGETFVLNEANEVPFVVRRYNEVLYQLVQVHTTQDDWTPDLVPALWRLYVPEDEIAPWKPYDGTASTVYQIGDKVTHNGKTWECTVANNIWEPGVYGWIEI